MGGHITVCIRFEDGETVAIETWTNPMPKWFKNARLYNKDEAHLRQYLLENQEADYSPCPLGPQGYGLVVLDLKTNHILSHQGYSNFDNFMVIQAAGVARDKNNDLCLEIDENFDALALDNRISLQVERYIWNGREVVERGPLQTFKVTPENYMEMIKLGYDFDGSMRRWKSWGVGKDDTQRYEIAVENGKAILTPTSENVSYSVSFVVDTSPFTIIDYELVPANGQRTEGGWRAFRAKLEELGFVIGEDAQEYWQHFYDYEDEMDAEEDEEEEEL